MAYLLLVAGHETTVNLIGNGVHALLTHPDNPRLALGHGIHHCLGAPLPRLEGRIALGTLLARFPRLRLVVPAEQLAWRPGVLMNGLTSLPVAIR